MNTLTLDHSTDTAPDLRRRARRRELLTAVVMLAPSLVFLAAFTYWPIARSLIYGFFDVQLGSTEIFYVGWENYQRLWHDALFWQSLRNTVVYMVVTVPTSIGLALVLAVALDRKLRGTSLYRSVFFYPVMVPSVAAGMVWVFLYAPGYGPINGLMELLGLPKLEWLYDRQWALPAIIFMSIWKYAGYFMLILLAALQLVLRNILILNTQSNLTDVAKALERQQLAEGLHPGHFHDRLLHRSPACRLAVIGPCSLQVASPVTARLASM